MKRAVKITLIGLGVIALLGTLPFAAEPVVVKLGENSILKLAQEGNFCKSENCEDGVNYVVGFLEAHYGLSPHDVKWCMGVDVIAHYELPLGNNIKKIVTDRMYQRCGDPAEDEPVDVIPSE